ncbi:MAG: IS1380 family transposase [Elusimicrobia bacterium]|nr:IS1380 family transposase [Elusimicrobiota bacterium]
MQQKELSFKLEFSELEKITPYAGLGLYGELYRSMGLHREVDNELPGPKSGAGYEANAYICPISLMFIGGGKYLEDIRKVEADKGLRDMCQMKIVPSSDAIGDWLRRDSAEKEAGVGRLNDRVAKRMIRKSAEEKLTLDIDAMGIEAHKSEAAYTYQGYKGYMPLLGFIPEIGCCVGYEFREGNVPPAAGNYEFTKGICEKVERWDKQIGYVRSDSAGYQAAMINYCHGHYIRYTITVCHDEAVMRGIRDIPSGAWHAAHDNDGVRTGREYAEYIHTMNMSDHAFRVVVQRWPNPQRDLFEEHEEYCYHGIATNFTAEEKTSEEIIWWHNGRANSENYNKEVKQGFNLEYMPCGEYGANAVWFGIGILAYNMFIASKFFLMPRSWLHKTIGTIRWQFIHIAGRILTHAGSLIVRICGIPRDIYDLYKIGRKRCMMLNQTG